MKYSLLSLLIGWDRRKIQTFIAFMLALVMSITSTSSADITRGVTVIVHGYAGGNEESPLYDYWGESKIERLLLRLETGSYAVQYLPEDGTLELVHIENLPWDDRIDQTGDRIILFDWIAASNDGVSGQAEAAGDALFAMLVQSGIVNLKNRTSLPLHFIGHSRGTIVVSETVQRLGQYGIKVNYVTSLDPHDYPQGPILLDQLFHDPPVQLWDNVLYMDNYFQQVSNPEICNPSGRSLATLRYIQRYDEFDIDIDVTDLSGFYFWVGQCWNIPTIPHNRVKDYYWSTIDGFIPDFGGVDWYEGYGDGNGGDFGYDFWKNMEGFDWEGPNWSNGVDPNYPWEDEDYEPWDRHANEEYPWLVYKSTSTDPEGCPDILYNGDFNLDDMFIDHPIAGWSFHGGSGAVLVTDYWSDEILQSWDSEDRCLRLSTEHMIQQATHNRFVWPPNCTHVEFDARSPDGESKLWILTSFGRPVSIDIPKSHEFNSFSCKIREPYTDYIVSTLSFAAPNAELWIDNIAVTEHAPLSIESINVQPQNGVTTPPTICGEVVVTADIIHELPLSEISLYVDGQFSAQMEPYSGNTYRATWNTSGIGQRELTVKTTDNSGDSASESSIFLVDNTPKITHNGPWSAMAGSSFSIEGLLYNALENGLSEQLVKVIVNGNIRGQGYTNFNGDFNIIATAPSYPETYTVELVSTINEERINESDQLQVIHPQAGHDPLIQTVLIDDYNVSPEDDVEFHVRVENGGDYEETFIVEYRLYGPNGDLSDSRSEQQTLGVDESKLLNRCLSTTTAEGNYRLVIGLSVTQDEDISNNSFSAFIYCGSTPQIPLIQTKDAWWSADEVGQYRETGTYRIVCTNISVYYPEMTVDIYKNGTLQYSNVVLTEGDIESFDNQEYLVYAHAIRHPVAAIEHGVPISLSPLSYSPNEPHGIPGEKLKWKVTGSVRPVPPASQDIMCNPTVAAWYCDQESSENSWTRIFCVPTDTSAGDYEFYIRDNINGTYYWRWSKFIIDPAHDISLSSISPTNGSHYSAGDSVPISISVSAAGGYTEQPNVTLSITNSNSYSYTDSEMPTITGTEPITFLPIWDTTGLASGDYTITVTASIRNDINSGNNSQSVSVTLDPPPALTVDAQSSSDQYLEGDIVEIWATVTDNSTPVSDADVVAHLTWPDSSQTNPVMVWDSSDLRYEYTLPASQTGIYSGNVTAAKTGYSEGSDVIENFTISNAPPDTIITSECLSGNQMGPFFFSWTGSDTATASSELQFSWRLDQNGWSDRSHDRTCMAEGLSEGEHIFYVKAFDGELEDPTPATCSFTVVSIQPNVIITTDGGEGTGNNFITGQTVVLLQGTANTSVPACAIESVWVGTNPSESVPNDGTPSEWEFSVKLEKGENILRIFAKDCEDNIGEDEIIITCIPGDTNGDAVVDMSDLLILASRWLDSDCHQPDWCQGADIDHSSVVDFADYGVVAEHWLPTTVLTIPSDGAPVPSSSLISGQWYEIRANGTYQGGSDSSSICDAEWYYWTGDGQWHEESMWSPPERNDLLINSVPVDWEGTTNGVDFAPHVFSPNHIYRIRWEGQGEPITLKVSDTNYGDNIGSLTVTITSIDL